MRRYERTATLLTSNRPVDHWGKLLGDTAAVTALVDRLLHHAYVLKCGPRSWRTKTPRGQRLHPFVLSQTFSWKLDRPIGPFLKLLNGGSSWCGSPDWIAKRSNR
jgi:hypothetical protein